ncbi:arginine repressor [Pediococcus siamensis]|uniref:arginine repressor n=1 Tax=Pediococcus siamensis TaxID=381829 RepID=UPI0039A27CDD
MRKNERQKNIEEILTQNDVQKQEDLVAFLDQRGIEVTQATISRDIRDMQLVKLPSKSGGYHYALPLKKDEDVKVKLKNTLQESLQKISSNATFIFLMVQPGSGPAIASLFNQLDSQDILGAISDDGSVLIITTSLDGVNHVKELVTAMLSNKI